MNQTQHLLDIAKRLTPAKLSEVIDFAEYLERRQSPVSADTALESLFGRLKDVAPFADGDAVQIQRGLRDEWSR